MKWVVAIPDPEPPGAALPSVGRQSEVGQQGGEHGVGVGALLADEGTHPDAGAPLAGEGPAESVVHQAEVKAGRIGFKERAIHFHRHRVGKARTRRAETQRPGVVRAGSIRHHQARGPEGLTPRQPHLPEPILPADRLRWAGTTQFGARLLGLTAEERIEHPAAHDPEGRITGKLGGHRILQGPGETHPPDHLIHGRGEVEGKPALHRGGHAPTTGIGLAWTLLLLQQDHAPTGAGQVKRRSRSGRSGPHHDGVGGGSAAQTLRMSVSLSARCFSSSLMKRSVSFCTFSWASRLWSSE